MVSLLSPGIFLNCFFERNENVITFAERNYVRDMTAAALNTEVFYQLSLIADDVNYLQKTLDFIKSLTKKSKLRRREYVELLRQLSDFQEYDCGWDGLIAVPLTRLSIMNFKEVLKMRKVNNYISVTSSLRWRPNTMQEREIL